MHRLQFLLIVIALIILILVSACGGAPTPALTTAAPVPTQAPTAAPTDESAIADTGGEKIAEITGENLLEELDPANFSNPTVIDNPWLPMRPGTQYVYEGSTEDGGAVLPHRLIITITDLVKEINGLPTVVVWDQDFSADQLVEAELAFYAQDNDGNLWRLGEYPEAYDEFGNLTEVPDWIHGLKGAKAGILIKADQQPGEPSYSQGWGPAVGFTDRAQVAEIGAETCVPVGCYQDVLVMEEFTIEEPDAFQLKYYAQGVGNVRVGWKGEDATKEDLELVEVIGLTPEALAEVRTKALELEQSAYKNSKEVYGSTPPLEVGNFVVSSPSGTATPTEEATGTDDANALAGLDPANFSNSTLIDNHWSPMRPGMQYYYEGTSDDGGVIIPYRRIITITDLTKEIGGIRTVVAWEQESRSGLPRGAELAFYAQDDDGNIWRLGEYTEFYDEFGKLIEVQDWIHGFNEALAGMLITANPQLEEPSYSQGLAANVSHSARVAQAGEVACVLMGCFQDVLVVEEIASETPEAVQLKYYAEGIGYVKMDWQEEDEIKQTLEIYAIVDLPPEDLAEVRAKALELEQSAYENSKQTYDQTPPSE